MDVCEAGAHPLQVPRGLPPVWRPNQSACWGWVTGAVLTPRPDRALWRSAQRIRLAHAEAGDSAVLTVPWLHVLAEANEADPFLVKASHVERTCSPALVFAGRTFRAAFACAEEGGKAEMHDGRVYEVVQGHISAYPTTRYRSCRVLWYDDCAEDSTLHCAFFQTDCERSPWELLEARDARVGVREDDETTRLVKAKPTVRTVLRLLGDEDGAKLLAQPPSKKACPRYYEVVEGQPVTLSYLRRREREGSYAHSWEPFWADLQTMVSQAKAFNQEERIEWRCERWCTPVPCVNANPSLHIQRCRCGACCDGARQVCSGGQPLGCGRATRAAPDACSRCRGDVSGAIRRWG